MLLLLLLLVVAAQPVTMTGHLVAVHALFKLEIDFNCIYIPCAYMFCWSSTPGSPIG